MTLKGYVKVFKEGFHLYIEGKWAEAKKYMEQVEQLKGIPDFPSTLILSTMEKCEFKAPEDWKGFRALTSK